MEVTRHARAPCDRRASRVLATGGSVRGGGRGGTTALDLAYANAPALAATVHMTLAEIASGTGDLPGAVEHLAMAP